MNHKGSDLNIRDTDVLYPRVRIKAPKAWILNDPKGSLLPKPLNPYYLPT